MLLLRYFGLYEGMDNNIVSDKKVASSSISKNNITTYDF
jgi:hypothetical protein